MTLSRRALLITGGAAAVVVAGATGWGVTRAPRAARAPWRAAADGFGDPRLDTLAFAILAPSPHNMQPWRIVLDGDDAFTVQCDLERTLPNTDPLNRQITIGFGGFLELARLAAAEKGYQLDVDGFPEGEPEPVLDHRPIARARLVRDAAAAPDPLFAAALDRRTNRLAFADRAPDEAALAAVRRTDVAGVAAFTTAEPNEVASLRELAVEAWRVEWNHPPARRESVDVLRIGKKAINENPYGLALSGPGMEALGALGVLTPEAVDDPTSVAFRQSLEIYEAACRSAAAFVWSTTATNSRRDQLAAGAAWVRTHLAATQAGLACHPLSQALQEYPEMAALYDAAHARLAPEGGTVQMLARLGYAADVAPAPRHDLMSRIEPV